MGYLVEQSLGKVMYDIPCSVWLASQRLRQRILEVTTTRDDTIISI